MPRLIASLALVGLLLVAAGASAQPPPTPVPTPLGTQDVSAPVLVQGTLLDESGAPMAGHDVTLEALDPADDGTTASFPPVTTVVTETGSDGSFMFRVRPTPDLVALAGRNEGWINFRLRSAPAGTPPAQQASAAFSRMLAGDGWSDTPETIQLQVGAD